MAHPIDIREFRQLYRTKGAKEMGRHLTEALDGGDLQPEEFDFCELFETFYGAEGRAAARPGGGQNAAVTKLMEAADAVDSTAFLDITQRVISSALIGSYNLEDNIAASLVSFEGNIQLRHERRPGITTGGDEAAIVHEGMPYEHRSLGSKYQDFGDGVKRGDIVAITKEALHFTGASAEIIRLARARGEWLGVNKDKRIWDVILGATNNYNWNGVVYNTYQPATPWINIHINQLQDWTDIDNAERLWDNMTDPNTGEPLEIGGVTIIVMPGKHATARRILTAAEVRHTTGATLIQTNGANPLDGYTLVSKSRRALQRLVNIGIPRETAEEVWLMGDFKKAFVYRENWPITVTQEPLNAPVEFEQDIVMRFKGSERGLAAVLDPRYAIITSGQQDHSSSGETDDTPAPWPGSDQDN